jgi:hypothetical protein
MGGHPQQPGVAGRAQSTVHAAAAMDDRGQVCGVLLERRVLQVLLVKARLEGRRLREVMPCEPRRGARHSPAPAHPD